MASLVPLISRGEVGDYCWKSEVVYRQRDDAYQEHLYLLPLTIIHLQEVKLHLTLS